MVTTSVANPNRTRFTGSVVATVGTVNERGIGRASATCTACGFEATGTGFGEDAKAEAEQDAATRILGHMNRWHKALEPGDGVTLNYPQDAYGYVVVEVSKNGKVVTVVEMPNDRDSLGGEPSGWSGPFPIWSKTYTRPELLARVTAYRLGLTEGARTVRLSLRKDGKWRQVGANYAGSEWGTNGAVYYRDYSW